LLKGKIYKAVGGYFYVREQSGKRYLCRARGKLKKDGLALLAGDNVLFVLEDTEKEGALPGGIIEEKLPRVNVLNRPPVANVDQLIIVMALKDPPCDWMLVSRLLIQAEKEGLLAVVCLNKLDLINRNGREIVTEMVAFLPYPVIYTSALHGEGLNLLLEHMQDKCSVMAGPSGAGKSSILNRIDPSLSLTEGDLSRKTKRGKHTTRLSELMMLEIGGSVVDTPGFTKLDLDGIEPRQLASYFPEIKDCKKYCEFRDCLHLAEPGCAVKTQIKSGISPWRYDHYVEMIKELKE